MPNEEMLINGLEEVEDKRVSIKDILDFIFEPKNIEEKTILSADNIDALIKMRGTNAYLKKYYSGINIQLYDTIIKEKRINIISHKGRGRDDILHAVKAMQNPTVVNDDDK